MSDGQLVAGRVCGSCNVCCVAFTIDVPELQKLPGIPCHNCRDDGGCEIYDSRPQTCRSFHCGWRRLKWVREPLRPDLSGVVIRLTETGVVVTLLRAAGLAAEGLAETLAAAVRAGIAVELHVPGPPGFTASRARVNETLDAAVQGRDKVGLLLALRGLYQTGLEGAHRPVVLESHSD